MRAVSSRDAAPPDRRKRAMRRLLAIALLGAACAWAVFGAVTVARRAPRPPPPAGVARGAWHVHTTHSDGHGTLADVVAAARGAGLQFVVVTDHNVLTADEEGWHDGVLVVQATEVSTGTGHVVALGVPRALTPEERERDPLGTIAALGGVAVLAHPLHPRRPWTGWGREPWRGLEIVNNDASWFRALKNRAAGQIAHAVLLLPFDPGRAVVALMEDGRETRRRFDESLRAGRAGGGARPARVLFCAADAHGLPSYGAAFAAFSMHLPVALRGDAAVDVPAVRAALAEGRGACVLDAVAPAGAVGLAPEGRTLVLSVDAPDLSRARFTLLRDGEPVAAAGPLAPPAGGGPAVHRFDCGGGGGGCPTGDYRVEGSWDGRPWIFTNPASME